MDFDFSTLLSLAVKWLSSGTTGIITGIFGLGGIAAAIFYIFKKMREAKYKNNLDRVSGITGSESSRLARGARANTDAIDQMMEGEVARQKSLQKPEIIVPKEALAGEPFIAEFRNIQPGLMIYADKNWDLKAKTASRVQLILFGNGRRTIDVKIGSNWCSAPILVKKET